MGHVIVMYTYGSCNRCHFSQSALISRLSQVSLSSQLAMVETGSLTLTAILRSSHSRDSYRCSELSFTTPVEVSEKLMTDCWSRERAVDMTYVTFSQLLYCLLVQYMTIYHDECLAVSFLHASSLTHAGQKCQRSLQDTVQKGLVHEQSSNRASEAGQALVGVARDSNTDMNLNKSL
jgi:hypothetical protein